MGGDIMYTCTARSTATYNKLTRSRRCRNVKEDFLIKALNNGQVNRNNGNDDRKENYLDCTAEYGRLQSKAR